MRLGSSRNCPCSCGAPALLEGRQGVECKRRWMMLHRVLKGFAGDTMYLLRVGRPKCCEGNDLILGRRAAHMREVPTRTWSRRKLRGAICYIVEWPIGSWYRGSEHALQISEMALWRGLRKRRVGDESRVRRDPRLAREAYADKCMGV